MIDHDKNVGQLLDLLDELGIAEDTMVVYSTDNGPHQNSWPDAGTTPFRSEKNTNWEGAFRVPEVVRWPGKIPAGVVSNEIIQHHDWLPTFLAAAGEADVVEKLTAGHNVGDKAFRVHIDGFNLLPRKVVPITSSQMHSCSDLPTPDGLTWSPAQTYTMGSDRHYPEERPAHQVTVDGFWMETHRVSNAQFEAFADATGYLTVVRGLGRQEPAERGRMGGSRTRRVASEDLHLG